MPIPIVYRAGVPGAKAEPGDGEKPVPQRPIPMSGGWGFGSFDIAVHDQDTYAQYVERYGGRYLARGGKVARMANGWNPQRVLLIEFGSSADVRRWLQSDEYRAVAPFRERSTAGRVILVEGCD